MIFQTDYTYFSPFLKVALKFFQGCIESLAVCVFVLIFFLFMNSYYSLPSSVISISKGSWDNVVTIFWSDMSVLAAAASGNQFSGGGGSTFSTPMSSLKLLVTSLSLPIEDLVEEVKQRPLLKEKHRKYQLLHCIISLYDIFLIFILLGALPA